MKVRLKVPFAGTIGGLDSPRAGQEVDLDEAVGKAMIEDGRAETMKPSSTSRRAQVETTTAEPPENAAARTERPRPRRTRTQTRKSG